MDFAEADLEKLRPKLRYKVCHAVGFVCPDVDDIVQETLKRFLLAAQDGKIRNADALGAFLNGICENVILEFRRRWSRDMPVADAAAEAVDKRLPDSDLFDLRDAIAVGMQQLSARDRHILRAFYLDETPKSEILASTGLTDDNFRVALCRAKERFRQIYNSRVKHRAASSHT